MNITVDARLLTKNRTTGIEEYTRLLWDAVLKERAPHFYSFFYNGVRKAPFPNAWRQPCARVLDWHIPNKLLDGTLRFLYVPKMEWFAPADIVYSPHINLVRLARPERHVMTVHDCSFLTHPDFFPLRKRFWHWQQDIRSQVRSAGKVIAVSHYTKESVCSLFGIPHARVETIYSGVNPYYQAIEKNDSELVGFLAAHQLNVPFVLSVGTFEPRKNIPATIRAFSVLKQKSQYRDLKLVLAGSPGWMAREVTDAIRVSGVRDAIIIWENASHADLRHLYNAATVFAYPSFFEGFGFPPLEAQACGCPVVASNRASLPEVLGDSALLVDPWRVEELVAGLETFLTDDALRNEFRVRGFENIKRFSWQYAARQLLEVFETIPHAKSTAQKH